MGCASCKRWRRRARSNYGFCFASWKVEPFWVREQRALAARYNYEMPAEKSAWVLTHPSMGADCAAYTGAHP